MVSTKWPVARRSVRSGRDSLTLTSLSGMAAISVFGWERSAINRTVANKAAVQRDDDVVRTGIFEDDAETQWA